MIKGIDVSHHQGNPDFSQVKKAGYSFVFVKATEGRTYQDPAFQPNMFNALKAGLEVGAYHFARPQNSPEDDADNFIKTIDGFKYTLRPVLDLEVDGGKTGPQLYQWARAFVARVKEKTGHECILYTGVWFLNKYPALKQLNDLTLWIAIYGRSSVPETGWDHWAIWQYSDKENIPGVGGCDANVLYRNDFSEIKIGGDKMAGIQYHEVNQLPLSIGATGDMVRKLQARLNVFVDGLFGPGTEIAVENWQQAHGLKVDGIVGPATWAALFPQPKPQPAPQPQPKKRIQLKVNGKVIFESDEAAEITLSLS